MPDLRTEITEIVTGLGMTGIDGLPEALDRRPAVMRNVTSDHWRRLDDAYETAAHEATFRASWANGRAFLHSPDGLRGRVPAVIEWKGTHRPPGVEFLPTDLRVDHVYLVSCKYRSKILTNSSPENLFVRCLADRSVRPDPVSWYATCAPGAYEHFYACVRRFVGQALLPPDPRQLTDIDKGRIRLACGRSWPPCLADVWAELSFAVAEASANRWAREMPSLPRQEEMLWRLLRLNAACYFVLGSSAEGAMRLRIGTPWDWRQRFTLHELVVGAVPAGQPKVTWTAWLTERPSGELRRVEGHVEIRWAHGRFSSVEAKVYLDTPHAEVPGYFPLPAGPVPSPPVSLAPASPPPISPALF
jgi:hypothetical protein